MSQGGVGVEAFLSLSLLLHEEYVSGENSEDVTHSTCSFILFHLVSGTPSVPTLGSAL